ncbi:MAG: 1-deoxy-D-xylulose-5-phosphate reductoisomerase [Deltaproteobacteria bacterium RIFCSPLOWO2_02_FULL_53_8]|nr:MAG: 1-deoxy-D-xylulose-5-phosphate reductoisomerase [Deltaproteobacteria bacterium RIFCSPLOWO2_02_FULL_53_8]
MKGLAVLGSTGSIGKNTLEVVRRNPGGFKVFAIAAGNNVAELAAQIAEFRPEFVSVSSEAAAADLKKMTGQICEIGVGAEGAVCAATHAGVDMVVSAITGAAGLLPTMAAIKAGKDVALANKETLVMAGQLVMDAAKRHGVRLLPVDSEHCAIFQSMAGHRAEDVSRIILTASGGPLLETPLAELSAVTPDIALNHPRWKMGRKISVDSATMMNKGLEVIEAAWLFGLLPSQISVCIHSQSIVHSMVEYVDGSIMAQLSEPDMKGPISYALSYPSRMSYGGRPLSFSNLRLDFSEPDLKRFPCLSLAYKALDAGGTAPAVLNAADEAAVEAFLNKRIKFTEIYELTARVLDKHDVRKVSVIEDVLEADRWARQEAGKAIREISGC